MQYLFWGQNSGPADVRSKTIIKLLGVNLFTKIPLDYIMFRYEVNSAGRYDWPIKRNDKTPVFGGGFIEDLLEVTHDPNYQPKPEQEQDPGDAGTYSTKGMTFSLMDESGIEDEISGGDGDGTSAGQLEELDTVVVCTGVGKRDE